MNSDSEEPNNPLTKRRHVRSKSESGLSMKEQDMVKRCKVAEAKLEQSEIRLTLKVRLSVQLSVQGLVAVNSCYYALYIKK